ncbi:hypothetical protein NDU88_002565 [Pleurodeles waltl]|uniref:Uncharacterized protein n=1 Tax=Pleurodeles waltl TaxID=8319 RepID=A0AAV7UA23_PLEWA|nr:hypothetical protein NDU88_002565 [Pleurodeles waltl]
MERGDPKQKQLSFDNNKTPKTFPIKGPTSASSERGATPKPDSTADIMAELRADFRAIDSRFDALDSRLGHMNKRIDLQATRMDGAEPRISEVEDGCINTKKRLERVIHLLKTVATKKEDLEARSRYRSTNRRTPGTLPTDPRTESFMLKHRHDVRPVGRVP